MNLNEIKHRDEIAEFLNKNKLTGAAAEIGVMHGGFSKLILGKWKGKTYYMVDLWKPQDKAVYREDTEGVPYEARYEECVALAAKHKGTKIIRDYSVAAAKTIKDESLDWVFIDANHAYGPVLEDMDAWFPKLKKGGLFSGHDYGHNTTPPHWCEVQPAVDRWMAEHKIPFVVSACQSWWAIKP